jgi:hypothetical protein
VQQGFVDDARKLLAADFGGCFFAIAAKKSHMLAAVL